LLSDHRFPWGQALSEMYCETGGHRGAIGQLLANPDNPLDRQPLGLG
jgi:hypothetical protein